MTAALLDRFATTGTLLVVLDEVYRVDAGGVALIDHLPRDGTAGGS